jgi:hypothetical protein
VTTSQEHVPAHRGDTPDHEQHQEQQAQQVQAGIRQHRKSSRNVELTDHEDQQPAAQTEPQRSSGEPS